MLNRMLKSLSMALLGSAGACFPTHQAARIEPGFRVDAGAILLADQPRHGTPQGRDVIATITPAYGFGRQVELGIPIGIYDEGDDYEGNGVMILPYVKAALLPPESKNHLSISAQTALIFPTNFSVHFGRDLGRWEPQVSASYILSGGPAGDDPIVTRYQQAGQSLQAVSFGATWNLPTRPAIDVGILRNSYQQCGNTSYCAPGVEPTRITLYDVFVGLTLNVIR